MYYVCARRLCTKQLHVPGWLMIGIKLLHDIFGCLVMCLCGPLRTIPLWSLQLLQPAQNLNPWHAAWQWTCLCMMMYGGMTLVGRKGQKLQGNCCISPQYEFCPPCTTVFIAM